MYCIRIGNKNAIFIGEKFLTSLSHDERSESIPALTHESAAVASTICGPAARIAYPAAWYRFLLLPPLLS